MAGGNLNGPTHIFLPCHRLGHIIFLWSTKIFYTKRGMGNGKESTDRDRGKRAAMRRMWYNRNDTEGEMARTRGGAHQRLVVLQMPSADEAYRARAVGACDRAHVWGV